MNETADDRYCSLMNIQKNFAQSRGYKAQIEGTQHGFRPIT